MSTQAANQGPARSVAEVLLTDEMPHRRARNPDINGENDALLALARMMGEGREGILQELTARAMKLCRADSAGLSVLEPGKNGEVFRWKAVAGQFADNTGGALPREASPCGSVIDRNRWLLFREPARFFPESGNVEPYIYEALLVPFHVDGKPVGTLWAVAHRAEHQFDPEDVRLLTNLSKFAAAATVMQQRKRTEAELRASRSAALNLMEDAVEARHRMEHATEVLKNSEEQFRRAIENAPIPVILQAADGEVLQLSKTWTALTGYALKDVPTFEAWVNLAYGAGGEKLKQRVQGLFNGEKRMDEVEFEIVTSSGKRRTWLFSASPVGALSDGRRFVVGMALDITERLRESARLEAALEETRRAQQEAEAANRTKDQFLATLSHELRTPLTPVLTAAESLLRRQDLPKIVVEGLQMICRNVELENHFINDLLDITRISRGKLELVCSDMDLHEAIQAALDITRPEIEAKGQKLVVELTAKESRLNADFARTEQVFWNLLKNSSKFTPEKGEIRLRSWNERGCICVAVTDTGIGIVAESLPKIFDAFRQADTSIMRRFGGLGLGLAIARATVEALGGTISAVSLGMGKGATLTVELPLTNNAA
ncbi:MAG TPA: ATP-binding protein [Candidatus Saccharimonadales bacterium]|nr:ATP-binding protein [Candidatus Saccharimonadales bacterium]